jgi:hypothetical protein
MITKEILKPDVIGPGVNILAGWSEAVGPSGLVEDTRKTQFNIMSGISILSLFFCCVLNFGGSSGHKVVSAPSDRSCGKFV